MLCTIPMHNYCKVMLKRVYQTMLVYYSFFTHVYYILVKANVYIVYIICSSLLLLLLLIVLYCIVQNVCFTMYRIVTIVNTVHIYIYTVSEVGASLCAPPYRRSPGKCVNWSTITEDNRNPKTNDNEID